MHFLLCSAKLQLHRTCIMFSVIRFQTNFLDETMELFRALRNPPWEKTELRYVQWMAETKEKIEHVLLKDTEVPRLLQTCFMHLEVKSSISEFSIFPTELKTSYTYMHSNYVRNERQKMLLSHHYIGVPYRYNICRVQKRYKSLTSPWEQTVPLSLPIFPIIQ